MSNTRTLELQFSTKYGHFGSKEHFFHFFWGYVLPGMHTAITTTAREPGSYSLVLEDCGPVMNAVSQDLFSLVSDDIKFKKHDEFSDECAQVPRWDIMINFDSVLFEDEHSFRGSTLEYRDNEFLQSVLNQPGFLRNFQNELREVRSWVLGRVIGSEAAQSSMIIPSEPAMALSGPPALHPLKKNIIKFLEREGPWPIVVAQKVLRKSLNVIRRLMGQPPITIGLATTHTSRKKLTAAARKKRRRNQRLGNSPTLLLCRSPEPEYYSANGQAEAKKYGASRRTLVKIQEAFEFFLSKGHNVQLYEPGSDNIFGQIKKFYESEAVIGIKGAELSNVFWMKPGTKMFVITPSTMRSTPVYQRFARFLGITSISIYAADGNNPNLYRLRREIDDQL